jgi:hypothetical protein
VDFFTDSVTQSLKNNNLEVYDLSLYLSTSKNAFEISYFCFDVWTLQSVFEFTKVNPDWKLGI